MLLNIGIGLLGFVIGIFVYRNNVKDFSPYADKFDELYDKLSKKVDEVNPKPVKPKRVYKKRK